jgi:dihydroorotate dehydrogenase electron transfer subunit
MLLFASDQNSVFLLQAKKMKKRIHNFVLIDKQACTEDYYFFELKSEEALEPVHPGQFIQLRVSDSSLTFLRRPFSIHDVDYEKNTLQLLVKIIGPATRSMAKMAKGSVLSIIYPLGNGFPLYSNKRALLAGGGYGIAPLYHLGKELIARKSSCDFIFGAKSSRDLILKEKFRALSSLGICTEDGSEGFPGLITENPVFEQVEKHYDVVYTCGPEPMMKAIAAIAEEKGVECQLSLDNLMGCGFGVCLCCITPTHKGNEVVCVTGPVFNSKELKW